VTPVPRNPKLLLLPLFKLSIVIIRSNIENIRGKENLYGGEDQYGMWVGMTIYGARMWCGAHIKQTGD
jgi:hypothetical protein